MNCLLQQALTQRAASDADVNVTLDDVLRGKAGASPAAILVIPGGSAPAR